MKFVIIGPGALGCLLAALLSEAGRPVLLMDHRIERAEFIRRRGLTVERLGVERRVKVQVSTAPSDAAAGDLWIVCVKAYQTEAAIKPFSSFLGPESRVLTLQNGLGNVETLVSFFGPDRVWGGTTAQGSTELGLGQIRHAGAGDTIIAAVAGGPGEEARLSAAAEALTLSGISTRVGQDVTALIWSKVIVNVGINSLTAITRLRNGQLLAYQGTEAIMAEAVNEATAVTKALGIELLYPDALARVRWVAEATAENIASMLQDVMAKRPTEIEQINGAVARLGRRLGLAMPVNDTLTRLVKTIEASYGHGVDQG